MAKMMVTRRTNKKKTRTADASATMMNVDELLAGVNFDELLSDMDVNTALIDRSEAEQQVINAKGITSSHYTRADRVVKSFLQCLESVGKYKMRS